MSDLPFHLLIKSFTARMLKIGPIILSCVFVMKKSVVLHLKLFCDVKVAFELFDMYSSY